jgi:hypothetical protein
MLRSRLKKTTSLYRRREQLQARRQCYHDTQEEMFSYSLSRNVRKWVSADSTRSASSRRGGETMTEKVMFARVTCSRQNPLWQSENDRCSNSIMACVWSPGPVHYVWQRCGVLSSRHYGPSRRYCGTRPFITTIRQNVTALSGIMCMILLKGEWAETQLARVIPLPGIVRTVAKRVIPLFHKYKVFQPLWFHMEVLRVEHGPQSMELVQLCLQTLFCFWTAMLFLKFLKQTDSTRRKDLNILCFRLNK